MEMRIIMLSHARLYDTSLGPFCAAANLNGSHDRFPSSFRPYRIFGHAGAFVSRGFPNRGGIGWAPQDFAIDPLPHTVWGNILQPVICNTYCSIHTALVRFSLFRLSFSPTDFSSSCVCVCYCSIPIESSLACIRATLL